MNISEQPVNIKPVHWVFKTRFVLLMLFIFGPLALPLVWLSPKFSKTWKIWATLLTVVLTILLAKVTVAAVQNLSEHLKELQSLSVM